MGSPASSTAVVRGPAVDVEFTVERILVCQRVREAFHDRRYTGAGRGSDLPAHREARPCRAAGTAGRSPQRRHRVVSRFSEHCCFGEFRRDERVSAAEGGGERLPRGAAAAELRGDSPAHVSAAAQAAARQQPGAVRQPAPHHCCQGTQ